MVKKFISIAAVIKFLGISRPTIYRLIEKGLPNYKVGGRRLFDRDELIEWVKSHRNGVVKKTPEKKRDEKKRVRPRN